MKKLAIILLLTAALSSALHAQIRTGASVLEPEAPAGITVVPERWERPGAIEEGREVIVAPPFPVEKWESQELVEPNPHET